jgi:ABC-type nitrate/sulfonate/bicarbonate transport system permease component
MRERGADEGKQIIISTLSPIIILVIWETFSRLNIIDRRFLPAPSTIAVSLIAAVAEGALFMHMKATLFRVMAGFFSGAVPAVVIGIVMGLSGNIRAFVRPLIIASYPIPKIALFPLVMLFFGLGELSNIIIVGIGVFFPVLYNTLGGVTGIPRIYWDVASNFSARGLRLFLTVALPGALPSIFTGLKLGIGMALITTVVTEYVGAREGLGFMIWFSWQVFSVGQMFVGLMVISGIGFVLTFLIERFERAVIPWKT